MAPATHAAQRSGALLERPGANDVGERHPAARAQHPRRLAEDDVLDRRQVDDPVGDHCVEPAVLERQLGDRGLDEFDSLEAVALAEPLRLGELLVGEVDADDAPPLADHDRGAENVGP